MNIKCAVGAAIGVLAVLGGFAVVATALGMLFHWLRGYSESLLFGVYLTLLIPLVGMVAFWGWVGFYEACSGDLVPWAKRKDDPEEPTE